MKSRLMKVALIGIMTMVCMTGCGTKKFDVSKTMEVSIEGYNGYGVCELENEYEWIDDVMDWYGDSLSEMQRIGAEAELMDLVSYEVTPREKLSNGDTVTISAKISSTEELAFELVGKDITVKVEGLEEVGQIDPFENVEVQFEGVSPNGTATVTAQNESDISYELDKNANLSNGDIVTVTAVPKGGMAEYARNHGVVFSSTEKTFTVEGLASYATGLNVISDDAKEKMQKQAEDALLAHSATWMDGNSLKESEFLGYYYLTTKDGVSMTPHNEIYCVYKMTANMTGLKRGGDGKTKETAEETFYTYYKYSDVMILEDGTCFVDVNAGQMASNIIESDYGYWNFIATFYKFYGYKDIDSMFNDVVTKKLNTYNYENTVNKQ